MQIQSTDVSPVDLQANAIVVGVFEDGSLNDAAGEIDEASGRVISRAIESKDASTKAYSVTPFLGLSGISSQVVTLVGLGQRERQDRGTLFRAAGAAAKSLARQPREHVGFYLEGGESIADSICGAITGCTGQDLYRQEKDLHPFESVSWHSATDQDTRVGRILGDAVNLARRVVNEPPRTMYPEAFADVASEIARESGLEIEIWDPSRLEQERCEALLAVGSGSTKGSRLVILRHPGAPDSSENLALVGKGVTFDSGGLSLKPTEGMKIMKCDMGGAATVLGAMQAIARLGLPVNAMGFAGLVENMTGGAAYKLGDVLRARNGKTIEVLNTDAEGRIVLADVLSVAVDMGATKLVDLATLTGACVVALGTDIAGLMTNDEDWCESVAQAARDCGEQAWQLPMFPEFREQIKSPIADIKNIGEGRWGGAITAAKFLEEFVAERPWTHIDIAGPAFFEKARPWQDAGGTGAFVRSLVELVKREANQS